MSKAPYGRRHPILVSLTFDRPVTGAQALAAAKRHLPGTHYATIDEQEASGFGKFAVRSVRRAPPKERG